MNRSDDDGFLSRWSRRKVAARERQPLPEAVPAAGRLDESVAPAGEVSSAATTMPSEPPADLPPVESLEGLASDYRDFMRANIDPALKRAALRKLFADPHFNVMDGLDVYIDDYSIPDPIPDAMMATLEHAKPLFRPLLEARDAAAQERRDEAPAVSLARQREAGQSGVSEGTNCPEVPTLSRCDLQPASEQEKPEEAG